MSGRDIEQRAAFERAIEEDPEDLETRQVFADWLEERGFDDEARAQREWDGDEEEEEEDFTDYCCGSDLDYDTSDQDSYGCRGC